MVPTPAAVGRMGWCLRSMYPPRLGRCQATCLRPYGWLRHTGVGGLRCCASRCSRTRDTALSKGMPRRRMDRPVVPGVPVMWCVAIPIRSSRAQAGGDFGGGFPQRRCRYDMGQGPGMTGTRFYIRGASVCTIAALHLLTKGVRGGLSVGQLGQVSMYVPQ